MTAEQVTTATADFQVATSEVGGDVVLTYAPDTSAPPVVLTMPHEVWVAMGNPNALAVTLETKCDGCGCTDSEACLGGCSWAAPGLCSGCVS